MAISFPAMIVCSRQASNAAPSRCTRSMPAARAIASQQVFSRAHTPSEARLARKHCTTASSESRIASSTALRPPLLSFKSGVIWGALASWSAETPSFLRALALRAALVKRIPCSLGIFGRSPARGAGRQSQLTARLVLAPSLAPSPRCQSAETRDCAPLIPAQFVCTRPPATLASTRGTDQLRVEMFFTVHRLMLACGSSLRTCKQKALLEGGHPNLCNSQSGSNSGQILSLCPACLRKQPSQRE